MTVEKITTINPETDLPGIATESFKPSLILFKVPLTDGDKARLARDTGPGLPHDVLAVVHDTDPRPHSEREF